MCIYNSHAIHIKCGGTMTSLEFRETLIERLVEEHLQVRTTKRGRPSGEEDPLRLIQRHFPEVIPNTEKKQIRVEDVWYVPSIIYAKNPDTNVVSATLDFVPRPASKHTTPKKISKCFKKCK